MANRRKANEVHAKNGTLRKDRHGDAEKIPEGCDLLEVPKPPTFLNKHGKREWKRLCTGMIEMELLKTVDVGLIENACMYYGIFVELSIELSKKKSLFSFLDERTSQNNNVITTMEKSYKNYSDIVYKMGVSPIERTRIQIEKQQEEEDNPLI